MDYWLNAPSILWNEKQYSELIPNHNTSLTRRLNTVARLTIVVSVLLAVWRANNVSRSESIAFALKFAAIGLALNVLVYAFYRMQPAKLLNDNTQTFHDLYTDTMDDWDQTRPASVKPSRPFNILDTTDRHAGRDGPENPRGIRSQGRETFDDTPRLGAGLPSQTQRVITPTDAIARSENHQIQTFGLEDVVPAHIRNGLNPRAGTDFAHSLMEDPQTDNRLRRPSGAYQMTVDSFP